MAAGGAYPYRIAHIALDLGGDSVGNSAVFYGVFLWVDDRGNLRLECFIRMGLLFKYLFYGF